MKLIAIVTNRITKTRHAWVDGKTLCGYIPFPEEKKNISYSGTNNINCKRCKKKVPENTYEE